MATGANVINNMGGTVSAGNGYGGFSGEAGRRKRARRSQENASKKRRKTAAAKRPAVRSTAAAAAAAAPAAKMSREKADAAQKSRTMLGVIAIGFICILIVCMSAFSANLKRENNELQSENSYLQADIDSLNNQISDATNIQKIENTATEDLGMVYPDSHNCVSVKSDNGGKTDLAATIREEAYN